MTTYTATKSNAMTRVYRNMALSVFTTMVVAYIVSQSPTLTAFFLTGPMKWVVLLVPLAMVFVFHAVLQSTESPIVAHGLLQIFSATFGISMSVIFHQYSAGLITSAFLGATVLFTTMAIYGMTTKRDLTSIGAFLMVGLISLIIVSVINLFIGNSLLDLALSGIGVIIFLGFTAYDAQNIQEMVSYESNTNLEVMGALSLYLDFVNLFLDLLRLFGALASDD
jgi:FtsH-binding integral membrane protein